MAANTHMWPICQPGHPAHAAAAAASVFTVHSRVSFSQVQYALLMLWLLCMHAVIDVLVDLRSCVRCACCRASLLCMLCTLWPSCSLTGAAVLAAPATAPPHPTSPCVPSSVHVHHQRPLLMLCACCAWFVHMLIDLRCYPCCACCCPSPLCMLCTLWPTCSLTGAAVLAAPTAAPPHPPPRRPVPSSVHVHHQRPLRAPALQGLQRPGRR
jgi:hypothetical protein